MSDPSDAVTSASPIDEPTPQPAETPVPPPEPTAEPAPEPAAEPAPGPAAGPEPPPEPEPKSETIIDAIADLLQMAVNYLRQETAGVMRDKVVLPGQVLGQLVAFALAAAFLLALGIGFIAVAGLLVLAYYLGWPGALTLVGVVLLIGAGVFTYLKVRSIQT